MIKVLICIFICYMFNLINLINYKIIMLYYYSTGITNPHYINLMNSNSNSIDCGHSHVLHVISVHMQIFNATIKKSRIKV